MTVSTTPDPLFSPFELGGLRLKNRIVMAPMGTCLDEDGGTSPTPRSPTTARRAEGGVGTITVEGCLVSPEPRLGPEPKICGPEYLPGLKRLVDALRPYDVTIGVQLMHPGRQVVAGEPSRPSPVPLNSRAPIPHELTRRGDRRRSSPTTRAPPSSRRRPASTSSRSTARTATCPSNFLSPLDNRRDDEYGGTLENRARFSLESSPRSATLGPELPLVCRINGDDGTEGGFAIEDARRSRRRLEEAGAARSASRRAPGTRCT